MTTKVPCRHITIFRHMTLNSVGTIVQRIAGDERFLRHEIES